MTSPPIYPWADLPLSAYRRLTPQQFGEALERVGLNASGFAWLTGSNRKRVSAWLKGDEDIPPWVTLMCSLLTLPDAPELAVRVTREFSTKTDTPV